MAHFSVKMQIGCSFKRKVRGSCALREAQNITMNVNRSSNCEFKRRQQIPQGFPGHAACLPGANARTIPITIFSLTINILITEKILKDINRTSGEYWEAGMVDQTYRGT